MAGDLNVGTLTLNLQLQTDGLRKDLERTNSELAKIGQMAKSAFSAAGGEVGKVGERIGALGNSIKKIFGDDAPLVFQKFGKEMRESIGMGDEQFKGLLQTASALEGAFKAAGVALTTIISPIGAIAGAVFGLAAAIGAVVKAVGGADQVRAQIAGGLEEAQYKLTSAYNRVVGGITAADDWIVGTARGAANAAQNFVEYGPGGAPNQGGASGGWSGPGAAAGGVQPAFGFDPIKDLKDGAKEFAKLIGVDLEGAVQKILDLMKPGEKADKKVAAAKKEQESDLYEFNEHNKEYMKKWEAIQAVHAERFQQSVDWLGEQMKGDADRLNQSVVDREAAAEREKAALWRIVEDLEAAEQKMKERGEALGGGKIGDFFGMNNAGSAGGRIAGAGLNIIGSAAAGMGEYTGTALAGAGQGFSAGGPWGALIGAIVALLTKTDAFKDALGGVEDILKGLMPVLNELMKPIAESLKGAGKVLGPILDLVSELMKVLQPFNGALSAITDILGFACDALGSFIGSLNLGSDGSTDGGGSFSFGDLLGWITLEKPLNMAIDEISAATAAKNPVYPAMAKAMSGIISDMTPKLSLVEQREALKTQVLTLANDVETPANSQALMLLNSYRTQIAILDKQIAAAEAGTAAVEKNTRALEKFNDAFMNAPAGYRYVNTGFESQSTYEPFSDSPGGGGGGGGGGGSGIVIVAAQSVASEVIRILEQRQKIGATTLFPGPVFAGR